MGFSLSRHTPVFWHRLMGEVGQTTEFSPCISPFAPLLPPFMQESQG